MTHKAKLVWITPDAEFVIGYCARVSNPKNQDNKNVKKLLEYCIKHKHWSIFEQACMCVEITTTRAISPQILRHRSFSFQEFSQRYAEVQELDMPTMRRQDKSNRQNSIDDIPKHVQENLQAQVEAHFRSAESLYQGLLANGVAKECARAVLPMSAKTKLYMTGTIRSWLHYVDLRGDNGTQKEHQTIARQIGDILADEVPTITRAMWG